MEIEEQMAIVEKQLDEKGLEAFEAILQYKDADREKAHQKRDKFRDQVRKLEKQLEEATSLEDIQKHFSEKLESIAQKKKIDSELNKELSGAIMKVAEHFDAINPLQIVELTKGLFKYDDKNKAWYSEVKDPKTGVTIGTKSVPETIKDYLDNPKNDNLVKSTANTGGTGHRPSYPYIRRLSDKMEYTAQDEKEAMQHGVSVEDWVNDIRPRKMEKLRRNK